MKDEVFIVGGGPSLKDFPFEKLRDKDTIAVNYAVKYIPNPNYFIAADSGVIRKAAKANFWDMNESTFKVVVIGPKHRRFSKVKEYLPKYDKIVEPCRFDGIIGNTWEKFATGKNTGFCALQMAFILGYKKIHLLGIDLSMERKQKYFYDQKPHNSSPYHIFLEHFKKGLQLLKEHHIEVYSHSAVSRLNNYIPYIPIERVITKDENLK